ncbi:cysteine desulfurase family protein [Acidiferrobacter sp.]|uniref:cysteine desulfurase family protein n=1 Tax=Acidiferrobacter sp. TaxID=1872107 RepID=UPI00261E42D2|nr:cysteine desulfurase family protein [Acidiferrobacter sp.]
MADPIYLDYNATTPVAPEVVEAMLPFLREHFGNPSSAHPYGARAAKAIAQARRELAGLLGAQSEEIVFTGCATEANNLALRGVAQALRHKGRHIVTSSIEHPSVATPLQWLRSEGWDVTALPVDKFGCVLPENLKRALRDDTVLVSIMHANNEVGTIEPIAEFAAIAHARGALFHADAAQSVGKIPVDAGALGVDLLTVAGHKLYAPKGIGALYVRRGTPLHPVLMGAGQEGGLRPGTENVPHIVALGAAADLARRRLPEFAHRVRALRDRLHARLTEGFPELQLHGHPQHRLPNTLHVSFPGLDGRRLLDEAPEIAASVGSACHEGGEAVSGVLAAMALSDSEARGAVRLSLGIPTKEDDIDRAAALLIRAARGLQRR